jgi:hypothetical protein
MPGEIGSIAFAAVGASHHAEHMKTPEGTADH